MHALFRNEIKPMLPIWAMAASLPFVIRVAMPEDGDFAFLGLGLGCAILVARAFSRAPDFGEAADRSEPIEPDSYVGPSKCGHRREEAADDTVPLPASAPRRLTECTERTLMLAVLILVFGAAAVFTLFGAATRNPSGLPIPLLATLTVVPVLGIVPYLTLRLGKPFAAVVFAAFIVGAIKLASCVVVRFAYGPDALADGYMAGDWQTAKLMISLFWIGTVTLSIVLAVACHHRLTLHPIPATA